MIDNKTNLIKFLTTELLTKSEELPGHHELIVAGGSETPDIVVSSSSGVMDHLNSWQEEADTRLVLHAYDAALQDFKRVVVCSRDTDVLILLTCHETSDEI